MLPNRAKKRIIRQRVRNYLVMKRHAGFLHPTEVSFYKKPVDKKTVYKNPVYKKLSAGINI